MKLKFNQSTELEIVETYDADFDQTEKTLDTFKQDEIIDVDLIEDRDNNVDIQFSDGSMAFNVLKCLFTIIE